MKHQSNQAKALWIYPEIKLINIKTSPGKGADLLTNGSDPAPVS